MQTPNCNFFHGNKSKRIMWSLTFVALLAAAALVVGIIALVAFQSGGRGPRGRRGPPASPSSIVPFTITYSLSVAEFIGSFIEIPTSNVSPTGTTVASSYLAGRAALLNSDNVTVGTCSASFLNMQNSTDIFTDISNYIETVDGLIVTWFTPTNLLNLELDSLVNGMVTEAIVKVTTKVGGSLFFGQTFDLVVSSSGGRIFFQFTRIPS
jgi:hypothetical protein